MHFMRLFPYQISGFAIGLIFFLAVGCRRRMSPDEVRSELKQTWLKYLEKDPHFDPSRIHIKVLNVIYFEDKKVYNCQFKVSMKWPERGLDTVGIMTGNITKDFDSVYRKY